jgi:2'-5' RNA ligase
MRLFTGIDLPEPVRERLERLLMHLRPAAHLKWSPVYNLHLTLKFIGEWPEDKLAQLEDALRSVPPRSPIAAELKGLGWFPNPHHPRVFWVGLHSGEGLNDLVRDTEAALAPLGIPKDDRAHQRSGAAGAITKGDCAVGIGRIWFLHCGPISSLPQPARLGRFHLYQALGIPIPSG